MREFNGHLDAARWRQHNELIERLALAGVEEDQWPEYRSSGEEQVGTDEAIEARLEMNPIVRHMGESS